MEVGGSRGVAEVKDDVRNKNPVRERFGAILSSVFIIACCVTLAHAESVTYAYDALGRLIQVSTPAQGTVQAYRYDSAGNIVGSPVSSASVLTIAGFSPGAGGTGRQVTIVGSGFSTTASANAVAFNGAAATIVSATTTELVVSVPAAATSGPISVSVGGPVVQSTSSFTILTAQGAPTISAFSPSSGGAGSTITISGTNFFPGAVDNKVLINNVTASVLTASTTTLAASVPASASSGRVRVITPLGVAVSSTDFFVPPSGYSTVNAGARTTPNGTPASVSVTAAGQAVQVLFDAVQGERFVRVAFQGMGGSAGVRVVGPGGVVIASATSLPAVLELPVLPSTGTYTASVFGNSATGTLSVSVTRAFTDALLLNWGGTSNNVSSINLLATQLAVLTFGGAVGQITQMEFRTIYIPWTLRVLDSAGVTVWTGSISPSSPNVTMAALTKDDSYRLVMDPSPTGAPTVQFVAGVTAASSPVADGPAIRVSAGPNVGLGAIARIPISGTAGSYFSFTTGAVSGYAGDTNLYYNTSGTNRAYVGLVSCCGGTSNAGILVGPLPVTGTYYFWTRLRDNAYNQVDVRMYSTPTLTVNGSAVAAQFSTFSPQFQIITFSANSGQSLTLRATPTSCLNSTTTYSQLIKPGNLIHANGSTTGTTLSLGAMPATGQYRVFLTHSSYSSSSGTPAALMSWSSGPYSAPTLQSCAFSITSP